MVGVDDHVVGDTLEAGPFHADAAVAGVVGELFEQVGKIRGSRLREAAKDAGVARDEVDPAFDLCSAPSRVRKPRSPAMMW